MITCCVTLFFGVGKLDHPHLKLKIEQFKGCNDAVNLRLGSILCEILM